VSAAKARPARATRSAIAGLVCACALKPLAVWCADDRSRHPVPHLGQSGPGTAIGYRFESFQAVDRSISGWTEWQLGVLEKVNRLDREHLTRALHLAVPDVWPPDERIYSQLPFELPDRQHVAKFLVVHQPGQMFGAYESGRLVRWGPVSSGRRSAPTPSGLFHLNWRSRGRHSTVNPRWYMPWYFNFHNERGLSFHEYVLPGHPASHACVRLLERDAKWLFEWGETWTLDARGWTVIDPGTPVWIVGQYDFDAAAPWQSTEWLASRLDLSSGQQHPTGDDPERVEPTPQAAP
jgi:hypothetical protein